MLLLSRENIKQVFTMKDAIEADKVAFQLFSEGKTDVPLRTQIVSEKQNGTFLFMPSYAPDLDAAALKIINIFPDNIDKGLASSSAVSRWQDRLCQRPTRWRDCYSATDWCRIWGCL